MLGGNRRARRKTTRKTQTYNPSADFLWTRLWLWLWLDVSHLNSNLSKKTSSGGESCSTVRGPTGSSSHSRLCVLQGETSGEVCLSRRQETLFTRRGEGGRQEAGPWTGARLPPGVFRGQVFFGNDPSSAASLRSTTRKCDKDGWLWAGGSEDPQVPTTNHARPCGK